METRVVRVESRTVLNVLVVVLAFMVVLEVIWLSREVLTWILVALFLAVALNPAVDFFQRHGVKRRGYAAALTILLLILGIAGLGSLFIPTLVGEANDFVHAVPGYVEDVSAGRGPLGDLDRKYDIVDRVQAAVQKGGAASVLGLSGTAVAVTKSIITAIVAVVTIAFMTFFMLLEGPRWVERFLALLSPHQQERWSRVGDEIYKTIGGYVTGNLLISVIAGVSITIVLLIMGVPYAVALGLLVGVLDLIPLAGATLAGIVVVGVSFLHSVPAGIVVGVFFIVYQQLENHFLQPVIYGRTVQLSPLIVLVSVLIGAALAGILGALAAIPVAGTIQVILREMLSERNSLVPAGPGPPAAQD